MSNDKLNLYKQLVLEKSTFNRALRVAVLVGIILNLINNFENIVHFQFKNLNYFKVGLTFIVPYCVSTYSSVLANITKKNSF